MMIWGVIGTVSQNEGDAKMEHISDRFITLDLSDPGSGQVIRRVVAALRRACLGLADTVLKGGGSNNNSILPFLTNFSLEGGEVAYHQVVP